MELIEFIELSGRLNTGIRFAVMRKLEQLFGLDPKQANETFHYIKQKLNVDSLNLFLRIHWAVGEGDKASLENLFEQGITESDFQILSKFVEGMKQREEM